MKLSISNIAWDNNKLESHLKLLKELKCDGIEIAPSCIWKEPVNVTNKNIEYIKNLIQKYDLEVSSFHALLYTQPNLSIFKDKIIREETISYLKKLIKLANKLSVKTLVYGSPDSRRIIDKSYKECYDIAVDTFKKLAKECRSYDTCLCIEPLEPAKNNFILTSYEGHQLVKDVDDLGFGLHLDTGAMSDNNEDFNTAFENCKTVLKHIHVNDTDLAPPGTKGINHSIIAKPLIKSGYNKFISIEMRKNNKNNLKIITEAILYTRKKYFINL